MSMMLKGNPNGDAGGKKASLLTSGLSKSASARGAAKGQGPGLNGLSLRRSASISPPAVPTWPSRHEASEQRRSMALKRAFATSFGVSSKPSVPKARCRSPSALVPPSKSSTSGKCSTSMPQRPMPRGGCLHASCCSSSIPRMPPTARVLAPKGVSPARPINLSAPPKLLRACIMAPTRGLRGVEGVAVRLFLWRKRGGDTPWRVKSPGMSSKTLNDVAGWAAGWSTTSSNTLKDFDGRTHVCASGRECL
mmetsp:Transcript_90672/g.256027  ORF Transcript_90672/g.256027 Transcript_90672/m.256027 type:complete len:250 (+) Transcript_90672:174-923(+)